MSYGGVFKTVVRVAASVIGGIACGPPCAAIGSAVATGATGGSFKEALIAGATSYIGASVSAGVTNTATAAATNQAAVNAAQNAAAEAAREVALYGSTSIVDATGNIITVTSAEAAREAAAQAAFEAAGGIGSFAAAQASILDPVLVNASTALDPVASEVSQFLTPTQGSFFGKVGDVARTGFDLLQDAGQSTLGALGFDVTPLAGTFDSGAALLGAGAGALTEVTLNQALLDTTGQYDAILSQKYSPEQIAALKQEARNALSQGAFDRLTTETANPFIRTGQTEEQRLAAETEFKKVIASGIERENIALGPSVTRQQFDARFNDPSLGQRILSDEQNLRRQSFQNDVNTLFNGKAFEPIKDPNIISSIVDDRAGKAYQDVANVQARGNLNVLGGKTAREYITSQRPQAEQRVQSLSDQLFDTKQQGIDAIKTNAFDSINQYKLGDELFNVDPYKQQRQDIVNNTQQTYRDDLNNLLGNEQLFNSLNAINSAGTAQGLVSGTGGSSNPALLDQIASRVNRRTDRGLGSRGSGVF